MSDEFGSDATSLTSDLQHGDVRSERLVEVTVGFLLNDSVVLRAQGGRPKPPAQGSVNGCSRDVAGASQYSGSGYGVGR